MNSEDELDGGGSISEDDGDRPKGIGVLFSRAKHLTNAFRQKIQPIIQYLLLHRAVVIRWSAVVLLILVVASVFLIYWSAISNAASALAIAALTMVAAGFLLYLIVVAVVAFLSIPFFIVLCVYGAFQHPKTLNTIRVGRSLIATCFIVILGGIYAEQLEASFAYGALNLSEEIVRGYSWIAVILLSFAYVRALYGEGLTKYLIRKNVKEEDKWRNLLLGPAFVLSTLVFDLVIPFGVTFSILLSFRCEGLSLSFEVWSWILEQFTFLHLFFSYHLEAAGNLEAVKWIIENGSLAIVAATDEVGSWEILMEISRAWNSIFGALRFDTVNQLPTCR